jgi:asparagine synthase (glutamine-hydrolysing)
MAQRVVPRSIAWRRKAMFRAPFDSFHVENTPPFVEQLLSAESLAKTGYFDAAAVNYWRQAFRNLRRGSAQRSAVEMGLVGVISTQLWHHMFIDGSLAELPSLVGRWWAADGQERQRRETATRVPMGGPHRVPAEQGLQTSRRGS